MRKDRKHEINVTTGRIQRYHEGGNATTYAFRGYKANKYFTSDRFIKLDENFNRPDGKPLQGYGLEIETECNGIINETVLADVYEKIIFDLFPADLFKMQHDISLGGCTNAECITQVMTKEFIRNNYAAFKAMYNVYFPAFQISCTSGNCGMHVNLSNALFGTTEEKQAEAIRKLLYLVNRHYDLFVQLTARDPNRTDYCRRMPQFATIAGAKAADLHNMPSSHGNCFNGSHFPEGRVELRIVGGQKDFGCFRNTMESVFHVVSAVRRLSWKDLDDITKVFAGCNQYVFDRLKSKCYNAGVITVEQLDAIHATMKEEHYL